MTKRLIYIHYDDGTKRPYASEEEAVMQASHDTKFGFGVPVSIADEDGKNVIYSKSDIKKAASRL